MSIHIKSWDKLLKATTSALNQSQMKLKTTPNV